MSPEEFRTAMEGLVTLHGGDAEAFHDRADFLLCEVLRSLGYADGVDLFDDQERWYA